MITILGMSYLTSKEVSQRYHYSISWLEKQRKKNPQLKFIRRNGKGRGVYYPLTETETFFKKMMEYK